MHVFQQALSSLGSGSPYPIRVEGAGSAHNVRGRLCPDTSKGVPNVSAPRSWSMCSGNSIPGPVSTAGFTSWRINWPATSGSIEATRESRTGFRTGSESSASTAVDRLSKLGLRGASVNRINQHWIRIHLTPDWYLDRLSNRRICI